uniref:Sulfatase domain-containing protein n=1 Tax=Parastrongyloides trichosuri TaxID=131310 RepID=A0A0N4ZB68_PARTI
MQFIISQRNIFKRLFLLTILLWSQILIFPELLVNNTLLSINNLENRFKKSVIHLKTLETPRSCSFPNYTIESNYSEFKHPYKPKECIANFNNNYVSFKNGILNYKNKNDKFVKCDYQCNYHKNDYELVTGEWKDIEDEKPFCDVFEVYCKDFSTNKTVFRDIYLQVSDHKQTFQDKVTFMEDSYKKEPIKYEYNVHLVIIDSISYFNALRGLPKTLKYLQKEYNGTLFKYLNKVGLNSLPNANAFLLNTRVPRLVDYQKSRNTKQSEYWGTGASYCNSYLDNKPFIVKYFRELNFTILNGEEAVVTAFNWPNCLGFKETIAHHTTRPYELRLHNKNYTRNGLFLKNFKKKCEKDYDYQLNYLSKFMEKYNKTRHLTYTWLTNIAHDKLTGFFHLDDYFTEFFTNNKKYFDNGFLIFMADHGFRVGGFRNTKQGEFEDANPFLLIAPPKALRSNDSEVMKNLKENSEKHISHFDIYTTLVDIATEGSKRHFKNMTPFNFTKILKNNKMKGLSLLRNINVTRDCYNMEITSEYCMCQIQFREYNSVVSKKLLKRETNDKNFNSSIIPQFLKKIFVNELNRQLKIGKLEDDCTMLMENPKGLFTLEYALNENNLLLFKVKQQVLPRGIFEAIFDENGKLITEDINRVDRYGPYAEICVPRHPYRKFCYCKSLLKKSINSEFKS